MQCQGVRENPIAKHTETAEVRKDRQGRTPGPSAEYKGEGEAMEASFSRGMNLHPKGSPGIKNGEKLEEPQKGGYTRANFQQYLLIKYPEKLQRKQEWHREGNKAGSHPRDGDKGAENPTKVRSPRKKPKARFPEEKETTREGLARQRRM